MSSIYQIKICPYYQFFCSKTLICIQLKTKFIVVSVIFYYPSEMRLGSEKWEIIPNFINYNIHVSERKWILIIIICFLHQTSNTLKPHHSKWDNTKKKNKKTQFSYATNTVYLRAKILESRCYVTCLIQ